MKKRLSPIRVFARVEKETLIILSEKHGRGKNKADGEKKKQGGNALKKAEKQHKHVPRGENVKLRGHSRSQGYS